MSSGRALQPAAGILLCLGTSYAVFSLGDSTSEPRRRLASHARDARREVLLAALTKRLRWPHQHATEATPGAPSRTAAALPAVAAAEPELFVERFYVVTGPDAFLTSLAHHRLSDALISSGFRNSVVTNEGLPPQPPARLVVPYDCLIGTGAFSSLLEQQLLSWQTPWPNNGGGSPSQAEGIARLHPTDLVHQQQQEEEEQRGEASNDAVDEAKAVDAIAKAKQEATAVPPRAERPAIISWRDTFVLEATRALMDPDKLDQTALWALERALSPPVANTAGQHGALLAPAAASKSPALPPTAAAAGGNLEDEATRERRASVYSQSADREETEASGDEAIAESAMGGDPLAQGSAGVLEPDAEMMPLKRSRFVLEIEKKGSDEPNGGGRVPQALCGELARGAWRIAARELGHVIIRYVLLSVWWMCVMCARRQGATELELATVFVSVCAAVVRQCQRFVAWTHIFCKDRVVCEGAIVTGKRRSENACSLLSRGILVSNKQPFQQHVTAAVTLFCLSSFSLTVSSFRTYSRTFDSSANPWVLAELQQALQGDHERLASDSPPEGTVAGDDDTSGVGMAEEPGDASVEAKAEVVVVRVALPSAAEREQVRNHAQTTHANSSVARAL